MKVILAYVVHRIGSLTEGEEEISVGWIRLGVFAAAGEASSLGTGVGVILFGVFSVLTIIYRCVILKYDSF